MTENRADRTPLYVFLSLLGLLAAMAFRMVSAYAIALFIGGMLAVLSYPMFFYLRRRGLGPRFSSLLVTLAVFLLVIGPLCALSAMAVKQGVALAKEMSEYQGFSLSGLARRISHWKPLAVITGGAGDIETQMQQVIQSAGKSSSLLVINLAKNVPELLLQALLAVFACYFFLIDGRRFVHWIAGRLPLDPDVLLKVVEDLKDTMISTVWSGLAAASVHALLIVAAFLISRIPNLFLAAAAAFILAWIPVIGSGPIWISAAVYLYVQGSIAKFFVIVLFATASGVSDNLVRPLVLKGRNDLHSLVGLVAILGGISRYGVFGVFIGPVLAASLISLLELWPTIAVRFDLTFGSKAL